MIKYVIIKMQHFIQIKCYNMQYATLRDYRFFNSGN